MGSGRQRCFDRRRLFFGILSCIKLFIHDGAMSSDTLTAMVPSMLTSKILTFQQNHFPISHLSDCAERCCSVMVAVSATYGKCHVRYQALPDSKATLRDEFCLPLGCRATPTTPLPSSGSSSATVLKFACSICLGLYTQYFSLMSSLPLCTTLRVTARRWWEFLRRIGRRLCRCVLSGHL